MLSRRAGNAGREDIEHGIVLIGKGRSLMSDRSRSRSRRR